MYLGNLQRTKLCMKKIKPWRNTIKIMLLNENRRLIIWNPVQSLTDKTMKLYWEFMKTNGEL